MMEEGGMELCGDVPLWQAPELAQPLVEPSWEDMLNAFLHVPEDSANLEQGTKGVEGLVCPEFHGTGQSNTGAELGLSDELLWSGGVSDVLPDFCESLLLEHDGNLPGLSSEYSSLVDDEQLGHDGHGSDGDVPAADNSVEGLVTNLIDAVPQSSFVSKNGSEGSSAVPSPIANSPLDVKVSSPDTGGDSSDVGASGKSCDNFTGFSEGQAEKSAEDPADDDAKRESRLKRNRESASQSRMRKKSYMKDLEAKCRGMESQLGMLHQTVAFFSSQNAALREELALVKSSKGHGSKSGAMEPAALPSDSLPSESPSRRTTILTVQWELVVFLFHVLLLTLSLPALFPSQKASGENRQNEARESDTRTSRGVVTWGACRPRPPLPPERMVMRGAYDFPLPLQRLENNGVFRNVLRPFDRSFSIIDPNEIRTITIVA